MPGLSKRHVEVHGGDSGSPGSGGSQEAGPELENRALCGLFPDGLVNVTVPPAAIVTLLPEPPLTVHWLSLAVKLALGGGCTPPSADVDSANATTAPAASAARYSGRWRARRLTGSDLAGDHSARHPSARTARCHFGWVGCRPRAQGTGASTPPRP